MKHLSFGKTRFQKVKQKKKVNPKNEKVRVIEKAPMFKPVDLSDDDSLVETILDLPA
jgi:hypothetical protein